MYDSHDRLIDYLRVSITDRCNLRCVYCMPEEGVKPVRHGDVLSFEELERICRCAAALGVRKLKLTGGEPLVRKGVVGLIRDLKAIPGIDEITMTSNGILLGAQAGELAAAGLSAVNISLDTLDPDGYRRITRREGLNQVLEAVDRSLEAGLRVKLNCVTAGEFGGEQPAALAALARERPVDVRFIEMMPVGLGGAFTAVPNGAVKERLASVYGPLTPWEGRRGNGPAEYFSLEGFLGKIGFISPMSHRFCAGCNRVRLTATGYLKLCLQYDYGVDLREALRRGASDRELGALMERAIREKPLRHCFEEGPGDHTDRHKMAQIGG